MLETHENIESIAAEAADGVAATSAARWEQLRCATRELLRLTRQRDNVRSFACTKWYLRSVDSKRTTALK